MKKKEKEKEKQIQKTDFLSKNNVEVEEKRTVGMPPDVPFSEKKEEGAKLPIGEEELRKATEILDDYKSKKQNFDRRVIENEEWWKMRHWENIRTDKQETEPTSAWLFNSIMNKLADYSDNYPEPHIRARNADDVAEAQRIKNILPMITEANDYESTYMDTCQSKIKNGTGITGVFWNKEKDDIDIQPIDVLSIYWQPGVKNIQLSRNVFTVQLVDNDLLKEMYPELKLDETQSDNSVQKYQYEDRFETTDKSAVIDWYYKKNGILHYCKYVGTTVLLSTENEPENYPRGLYDDGEYPFVVDTLFKMEGTIAGFGYLDVCKSPQEYIDKLDQAIIQNAFMCARPRYFIRNDASINTEEFLNWKNPLVKTNGNLGEDDLRQISIKQLDAGVYNAREGKIIELKQTSGNSDVSTGSTANGVIAASAISQLIETGSKGSRLALKGTYRAYRKIIYMIIERMRQFYTEPRYVRIIGEDGSQRFETYDNTHLVEQRLDNLDDEELFRLPQFDIEVSANKASPYNKLSQNELALQFYGNGFFAPQNADMTLACLNMMDFDHKQEVISVVQKNAQLYSRLGMLEEENQKLKTLADLAYNTNLTGENPPQENPTHPPETQLAQGENRGRTPVLHEGSKENRGRTPVLHGGKNAEN